MEPSTAGIPDVHLPATNGHRTILNPFPRGSGESTNKPDLGVTQEQFEGFHSDFLVNNTIFQGEYVNDCPKPLRDAWESVQLAKKCILEQNRWELFRRSIHGVMRSTQDISQAACLGLGAYLPIGPLEAQRKWVYQYAAFDVMCGLIEQYQGKKIRRIFQDPTFTVSTKYLLEMLRDEDQEVVRLGEAEKRVNGSTFVYAIHLVERATCEAVLQEPGRFPALYIGNRIDDIAAAPGYIAKQVIEQTYMTGKSRPQQWMEDLRARAQDFYRSYEKRHFYYPEVEEWEFQCFSDTIVHRKLREREIPSTYEVLKILDLEDHQEGGPDNASCSGGEGGRTSPSAGHEGPANGTLGMPLDEERFDVNHDPEPPFEGETSDTSGKESPPLDSKRISTISPLNYPKGRKGVAGRSRFGISRSGSFRDISNSIKDGIKDGKKVVKKVGRTMSFKRKDQKRQD